LYGNLPWKFARLYRKVDFTSALAWAGKGARIRDAAKARGRYFMLLAFMATDERAICMPRSLSMVYILNTTSYGFIKLPAGGDLVN
jgi:hypothetical protein